MNKNRSAASSPRKHSRHQSGKLAPVKRRQPEEPLDGEYASDSPIPSIIADPEHRYLPFPLTDIQQAYWVGRSGALKLGHVSTHSYMELESVDVDLTRLSLALHRLIERHDMLRAIVLPDGRQQILEKVPPYKIEILDVRGCDPKVIAFQLEAVRQRMSHQVLPSDQWPLFEIRASRLDNQHVRLHISFDALILDTQSRHILFFEWAELYKEIEANLPKMELTFRDFVMADIAQRNTRVYQRAQEYWCRRLSSLPPRPDLPVAKKPGTILRPRFRRHQNILDPQDWQRLKERAMQRGLRPSLLLLSAFAEVLRVWSKTPRFSINLTVFNRMARDPRLQHVLGDYTSSVLVAVDNPDHSSFEERALAIQNRILTDLEHSSFSGVRVVREIIKLRGNESEAVMPVVFTSFISADLRFRESEPTAWLGEKVYEITQTPQVWLDHQVSERAGSLVIAWDVVEELFPEGLIQDMFNAHCHLLQRLVNEDESWQENRLEIAEKLIPPEQLVQRTTINATERPIPEVLLHTLFTAQVPVRPTQPAVVAHDRTLTYEELYRRACRIGHKLRQLGARPNTLVAVVMEKGWEQVVAALGVLVSGAAYLPVDPGLPQERWRYLLSHGEVELVVTTLGLNRIMDWPKDTKRVCVENEMTADSDDHPLEEVLKSEDLAYVIYTSGSTGPPKGVMITHRGAVNTILDINLRFGVGPGDRILALSSLSFDLSVYDIFGPLAAGGKIIMPEKEATRDPAHLTALIKREKITIWNSVPSIMALLVEYVNGKRDFLGDAVRLVMMSGDWIPVELPDQIQRLASGAQVISLGGATEASIWSVLYPVKNVDPEWRSIPYGQPMMNQRLHVLSEDGAPRPIWVPGQLYIGGIGLAKGYWRDDEKTRDSFMVHPRTGERLYRTGDLGRYLPDGNIEFLGREDDQVKVQGFRVELGEIEAALKKHPTVSEAVITAVGQRHEEKRLTAYVVTQQKPGPTDGELRHFLAEKIPSYMVPSSFIAMECLPLTSEGKIDRKSLPVPEGPNVTIFTPASEETLGVTARITQLIMNVLKIDHLDPDTNVLNLGATSIDMIRIANIVDKELNFRPRLDEFYRLPTVMGLVESFERHLMRSRRLSEPVSEVLLPTPDSVSGSFTLILDPDDREAFKNSQPGLRRMGSEEPIIHCIGSQGDRLLKDISEKRRSHRRFTSVPISFPRFSEFMSCLRQTKLNRKPKYLYGSAGGLYPVQTYVYTKPDCVESLPSGIYYYHPVEHGLLRLSASGDLDREVYDRLVNRPIFDGAAFAMFLIADLKAIASMYGDRSMHFVAIEAGLMTQLMETSAPACGIGLCQIGTLEFQRIRHLFALEPSHVLVHSLLGGPTDTQLQQHWSPFQEFYDHMTAIQGEEEEGEI